MLSQYNTEEFKNQLVLAGLCSDTSPIDLIRRYQDMLVSLSKEAASFRAEELSRKLRKKEDELRDVCTKIKDRDNTLSIVRSDFNKYKYETTCHAQDVKKLTAALLKYGEHKGNCGYIESLETGRINAKMTEQDCCDCGYVSMLRNALKEVERIAEKEKSNESK